jgi:nitrous oxide reductase accessory protein NosL
MPRDNGTMYAEILGSKDPTSMAAWYVIYHNLPSETGAERGGPFRDKTDAENAAEDLAKVMKVDLIWRG